MKAYEAIVKGENIPEPSIPESFKVLLKEMQSLALDVNVVSEEGTSAEMRDEDDDLLRAAEELGIDLSGVRAGDGDERRRATEADGGHEDDAAEAAATAEDARREPRRPRSTTRSAPTTSSSTSRPTRSSPSTRAWPTGDDSSNEESP